MNSPTQPKATAGLRKRITPQFVGEINQSAPTSFSQLSDPTSNAVKRVLKKADKLNDYYRTRGNIDEYPNLAF